MACGDCQVRGFNARNVESCISAIITERERERLAFGSSVVRVVVMDVIAFFLPLFSSESSEGVVFAMQHPFERFSPDIA